MPHSVLSIVFDYCTPAIRGRTTTSTFPHSCIPPLLMTIKGGGGLPLRGMVTHTRDHRHTLGTTEHSPQPTPLLAETWEPPSLSRHACTPYYKHSGCRIIQCPRTPPLLDVRPRGRNQDKPVRYCVASCIASGTRKHAAFTSWGPDPRVRTPTKIEAKCI